ncbi:MAG: type II toxin-antitoxin system RelE family toxin [Sulfobacillus sp.]
MAWRIEYTESARRTLRKLDQQTAHRIVDFMDERVAVQEDPRNTGRALSGPMRDAFWRYRVGGYRVICDLQDGVRRVLMVEIGHRNDVYR